MSRTVVIRGRGIQGAPGATGATGATGAAGANGQDASTVGCLSFDGTQMNVSCPGFWPATTDLTGGFLWNVLCKPGDADGSARYLISDGYGGGHALLLGFDQPGGDGTVLNLTGNVYTGVTTITFAGDGGLYPDEWGWVSAAWDGSASLWCYVNGIPVGKVAFAGPRQSPAAIAGAANDLHIGGSDHLNFLGKIACVQCWDDRFPMVDGNSAFRPYFPPEPYEFNAAGPTWHETSGIWDFTQYPRAIFPDISPRGRADGSGARRHHPAFVYGTAGGVNRGFSQGVSSGSGGFPRPTWAVDSTFPYQGGTVTAPAVQAGGPASVPVGCKIFDSFGRRNQTPAFDPAVTLGSTEGGSLGAKVWQYGAFENGFTTSPWGIWRNRAVYLGRGYRGLAWVAGDSATQDVRIRRQVGSNGTGWRCGVAYRVIDRNNFLACYALNSSATSQVIRLSRWTAGAEQWGFDYTGPSGSWNTLRVTCSGSKGAGTSLHTVYHDDGAGGWTQVGQLTAAEFSNDDHSTGTGAGLFSPSSAGANGTSALDRFRDFTVY